MRLPPHGVVRFLGWHVLQLEFWHFAHPKLILRFLFASVFAVFSSKKCASRRGTLYKKNPDLSVSRRFFSVFSSVTGLSHRLLRCFRRTCICISALCGGGRGGDNVHANATCVFCFFVASYACRISHRFLRCFCRISTFCTCQLRLAFVFQLCAGVGGEWRGGDDVHANAACVFCFFCCVTSETLPVAL